MLKQNKLLISFIKISIIIIVGIYLWTMNLPQGFDKGLEQNQQAWQLFVLFVVTIVSVLISAMPILLAAIIALIICLFTQTLTIEQALSGFQKDFIFLILAAFFLAQAVALSGLGKRVALRLVMYFGKSSLGLGYALFITDIIIAPFFASNTARSALLHPLCLSLAMENHSAPHDKSRRQLGHFLMMNTMASLSISSALWLTAMAANPTGAELAAEMGINITFISWISAAFLPCLFATIVIPYFLFKVMNPVIKNTPEAPVNASKTLANMGCFSAQEKATIMAFFIMLLLWVVVSYIGVSKVLVALLGFLYLYVNDVFTKSDALNQAKSLTTFIWFAILFTFTNYLNIFGFTGYLGEQLAAKIYGIEWQWVYLLLVLSYVFIHYFFVSQTAQLLALFSVFLQAGMSVGVPGQLLSLMLLFATNFNSTMTPYASSANMLVVGSGYVKTKEVYLYGGGVTLINTVLFLALGTPWIFLLGYDV